jgi:predicted  nucleic acid-binding Zn-ribbon protein
MEKMKRVTLETLRAEYAALTRQLAGLDDEMDALWKRREIVEKQRNVVNGAAIRIVAELEGAAE